MISLLKNQAKWISSGDKCAQRLYRHTFDTANIKKAKVIFAVLGIFEAYMNGKRIGEDYYLPLSTDFNKREGLLLGNQLCKEEFSHRLYCPVYDISELICDGKNSLAVSMGGGWYESGTARNNKNGIYGNSKFAYAIELTDKDGNISYVFSGNDTKWNWSFITAYSLFDGETHDYWNYDENWTDNHYDDSAWKAVAVESAPETSLYEQGDYPADRIIEKIEPKLVAERNGKKVYDCGKIITGIVKLQALCEEENIFVYYDEELDENGRPLKIRKNWYNYYQYSDFKNCKKNQIVNTNLTWHCFRFFEVTGNVKVIGAYVIHSDVKVNSEFESSDEILNWIYKAFIDTMHCNMHTGIPSDCPHIERKGYTGDGQLTSDAAMTILDAKKFYHKWLGDISDCQDKITGAVQYTAPFYNCGGGPGGWGCAIAVVPYNYYKHYGDKEILREFYPKILHWFQYLESVSENDLVVKDREGNWCLGDWCLPAQKTLGDRTSIKLAPPFVNTYFYIKALEIAYAMEEILHIDHAEENLKEIIDRKKNALIREYFDGTTGDFLKNLQGANAFAVDIGIGDERTFKNMVHNYEENPSYDTGIFGTDIVTKLLFEKGESDLAIKLLTSKTGACFYREMKEGFSTLWETWGGIRSHCHPMFGAVSKYLIEYVLGIRMIETEYKKILINPVCMNSIKQAKGKISTPQGEVKVKYDENSIKVTVPDGIDAVIRLNNNEINLTTGESIINLQGVRNDQNR